MADESIFRGIIEFFVKLGIYDVILPFLLVFTVVYAILEKTKVLGTDDIDGMKVGKKNINAMVAFVIAFLVVLSQQLVAAINQALANIVLLLLLIIMFLMLIGAFFKEGEDVALEKGWRTFFMVIVFVAIVLIFLNAIPTSGGDSNWLEVAWGWLVDNWNSNTVGGIILLIVVIILMVLITTDKKRKNVTSDST